jgi:putative intracellular protease/amidase
MRKVVVVGQPPVQVLDVTGPLEVLSSAGGYKVVLGSPGKERTLKTNRNIALAEALPIHEITGAVDLLVIAGGPGSESGGYDPEVVAWIADAAKRSRRIAAICTVIFLLGAAGLIDGRNVITPWKFCDRRAA